MNLKEIFSIQRTLSKFSAQLFNSEKSSKIVFGEETRKQAVSFQIREFGLGSIYVAF